MYRLGELTEQQRSRYGWSMMVMGAIFLAVGVILVHYAGLPDEAPRSGIFFWIPRGWLPKGIGYLVGFGASQLLIAGAAVAFVLGRKMTWALATFAAFLAWMEFVLIFGIVPSEWLNLAQTDLDWSIQRVAFTIPPWLSSAAKWQSAGVRSGRHLDGLQPGGPRGCGCLRPQAPGHRKGRSSSPGGEPISPYGRPLVRGDS